jgi:hypothetical protein
MAASGTFTYTASSNAHAGCRSATLTVSGSSGASQTFLVTEAGDTTESLLQREVRAMYLQILGRDPDQAGFNFWTGQGAAAVGPLVDQFLESPEAEASDFTALIAYQAATGSGPTFTQWASATAQLRSGSQTAAGLIAARTPNLTVNALYQNLLGRPATTAEQNQSISDAYNAIVAGAEFRNTNGGADHSNSLSILLLYYAILSRDPDPAGLKFWIGQADAAGPGLYFNGPASARLAIIGPGQPNVGFVGSPEFQGLFQGPGGGGGSCSN